jgi:outer membrane protein OmpA-like peptidoglycan-associated protein
MNRRTVQAALLSALAVLTLETVPGCSVLQSLDEKPHYTMAPNTLSCPADAGGPVTLVLGARQNSQRPDIPDSIETLLKDAAISSQPIKVILLDGQPSEVITATFTAGGSNQETADARLNSFLARLNGDMAAVRAQVPEADVLTALDEAADATPKGGTVVMIDSGIPTTGPVSFTRSTMFGADPGDIVTYLQQQDLMPDLRGKYVDLVGLGDVAGDQLAKAPLSTADQRGIVNLWEAIAKQGGARCAYPIPADPTHKAVTTSVPVSLVHPPTSVNFEPCGTTVLDNSGSVGFSVDTADFRDPKAANATLQKLADLVNQGQQQISLIGTTSSEGTAAHNLTLSRERADAVRAILLTLHVSSSRIKADGIGEGYFPGRAVDMDSNGQLIPWQAVKNRSVRVTLTCLKP